MFHVEHVALFVGLSMTTRKTKPARFSRSMMKRLQEIVPPPGAVYTTTATNGVTLARPEMRSRAGLRRSLGRYGMWIYDETGKGIPVIIDASGRTDVAIGIILLRLGTMLCGRGRRAR